MNDLPFAKNKQTGNKLIDEQNFPCQENDERVLQANLEYYINKEHPELVMIRIPDQAYDAIFNNPKLGQEDRRIISDYLRGLPDLTLLKTGDKYNEALSIELKMKTGKIRSSQQKIADHINVWVVRSYEQGVELIEAFAHG